MSQSSTTDLELGYQKDHSLYFFDGNIVIAAAIPDEECLLFRVHKSVLAMHSPIFAIMFTLPAPPTESTDPDSIFEGVPLLRMYDEANDVRDLLRFFYHSTTYMLIRYDPETPRKVGGLLRLAKKYQINTLWDMVVGQLQKDWPQTLPEWERLEGEVDLWQRRRDEENWSPLPCSDHVFPEPGSAIQLAREFDLHRILPSMFYHLSRLDISCDLAQMDDHPVRERIDDARSLGDRTANWSFLTLQDLKCLLHGREGIRQFIEDESHRLNMPPNCRNSNPKCDRTTFDIKVRMLAHSTDVLRDLRALSDGDQDGNGIGMCKACRSTVKAISNNLRLEIWEGLPENFKLPAVSDDDEDEA
ncbi:hypothetical protein CONPUDRAFT_75394 [Coniophora puteana RWD-64-598 SS2]|uniref:BTB domain-containing protein n=1 Tax=Coniophora puteana (strain RWD-64-598) TaxID=741705 RepID=A0A5M3MG07_CONPW|nr:uncharacterized protein CONPUDRAFT_75394 [Coniophora puteana RWD-64-598 SS2]EIW77531.1 hypothetical protein CONPUDRAFT_75394 [Coniophora puteana RWD-64-598 SS2]